MSVPHLVDDDLTRWDAPERFRVLREQAPVLPVILPGDLRAWLVTGAGEAHRALADERLAHDPRRVAGPAGGFGGRRYPDDIFAVEGRHLLNSDGEDHQRLRSVLAPGLARSHAFRPLIEDVCHQLVDDLGDEFDLVGEYARPLAVRVTGAVLGIPAPHLDRLAALTDAAINIRDPEQAGATRAAVFRLWIRVLAQKRREPGDDLLSRLLDAHRQGRVSAQELTSVAWGLFSGGISPMVTLLAVGVTELMREDDLRRALLEQPTEVIEELLRRVCPFPVAQWRFALQDVPLGGTVIPQGAVVLVALAAANTDPQRPRRHLSFGARPHHCPGASLARLQASIALRTLFARFPGLELAVAPTDLRWHGVLVERCYDTVPVRTR